MYIEYYNEVEKLTQSWEIEVENQNRKLRWEVEIGKRE